MGMSLSEFWEGDPYLCVVYREAEELRRNRENENLWLMGNYAYYALGIALSNAFRKSGAKPIDYLKEPFRITPMKEDERKRLIQEDKENTISFLNSLKKRWDGLNNGERP